MWRSINLCSDAGVSISVADEPIHPSRSEEGVTLSIYSLKPSWDWKPLVRLLLGEVEKIWPEKITFRGPSGQILSFEDAMKGRS